MCFSGGTRFRLIATEKPGIMRTCRRMVVHMNKQLAAFLRQFHTEGSAEADRYLGCHACEEGFVFRVWAPNAQAVSVTGDFNFWNENDLPMQRLGDSGVWEAVAPFAKRGGAYKYCGALLGAVAAMNRIMGGCADGEVAALDGAAAAEARELLRRFEEKNGSVFCRELKGRDTGIVLRECRGCVEDAAEIAEDILKNGVQG